MGLQGVQVVLIDLQVGKEERISRIQTRDRHYMKPEMVDSQLAIYGEPFADEVDVLPVNTEEGIRG